MYAGLAGDLTGRGDERPPLVLVHGLTFDRTTWRPALAALEQLDSGRLVLSLDLPGHGGSPARDSYRMEETVERIHAAVEEAGLVAPVVVGHSIGGVVTTVYAMEHPVSGVVNVDQSLEVEPFAAQVQAIAPLLAGPAFDQVWQRFRASMEIDLLPADGRAVAQAASQPRAELVRSYWADVIERPDEIAARAREGLTLLRARRTPYELVVGRPTGGERAWFARELPHATVTEMPGSGHFPQLADPHGFAQRLAATANWGSAVWAAA